MHDLVQTVISLSRWAAANGQWLRPLVFLGSGAVVACIVFLLARVPAMRRPQFQDAPAWPFGRSLALAIAVLAVFAVAGLA